MNDVFKMLHGDPVKANRDSTGVKVLKLDWSHEAASGSVKGKAAALPIDTFCPYHKQ